MRKFTINLLIFLIALSLQAQASDRDVYIQQYYKIAIREMQIYSIPASITMAQAILESHNGVGYLATNANNHFGIKCHDWTGPSVRRDDDEKNECFRKYFQAEDSFKDHSLFLSTRNRYAFLFDLPKDDYKAWAKGLKKAGYATDPKYPAKLIKLIEENELYLLDEVALSSNQDKVNLPVMIAQGDTGVFIGLPLDSNTIEAKRIKDIVHISNNGLRYIVIQDDITYQTIADNHNLHLWEVYKFNDIDKQVKETELGQRIYLQHKQSKIRKGKLSHTVVVGETMYEISQQYGIKLKSLYKINEMNKGTQAQAGDVLKLNKKAILK